LPEPSSLRVLQICSSSATSGAERHVYSLSHLLQGRGHHVEVVTPEQGWLPTVLTDAGVPAHTSFMKGKGWYRTMALLLRQVRRNKIDVIHTHLTRAAYIGYTAGLLSRVPVITSVHIANNDQIYKRLARRSNRLVAVSNFVRGMLHGRGIPERFIETVYNGTDFFEYESAPAEAVKDEFGIPRERRLIGLLGRVCREKGHLEMVESFREIRAVHPDAHLMFVGRVEEPFDQELQAAVDAAGIREHLTMTGIRHDVPRLLDSFAFTTMPSHQETFGVAAIEAMARGKAVVASRVGGLPEVVRHKQTGLLVDLRPAELTDAVDFMLNHDAEREAMGATGRRIVEEKFTLAEMVKRFEGVYERSLGRA
jgi:glycosyltransferase involved in cell wall biosynthesis